MKVDIDRPFQYENDEDVGVSVIDSYTHFVLEYLEGINKTSTTSMKDLVRFRPGFMLRMRVSCSPHTCSSINMIR